MPYLNIEYMDGEKESILVNDDIGAIRVREGQLVVVGGSGSYRTRGEKRGHSTCRRCTLKRAHPGRGG